MNLRTQSGHTGMWGLLPTARVAEQAQHGEPGVMTSIVNQQGRVPQTDSGPKTGKQAPVMASSNPVPTWQLSPDRTKVRKTPANA